MIFFAPHSIPIFLTRGRTYEPPPPNLKFFDAYYIDSPIVGLDIMGMGRDYPPCSLSIIEGACITMGCPDWDDTVIGFYVRPPVVGLEI